MDIQLLSNAFFNVRVIEVRDYIVFAMEKIFDNFRANVIDCFQAEIWFS